MPHPVIANSLRAKAHAHYAEIELQTKLEVASPHGLVKLLYEELEKSLLVLQTVVNRNGDVAGHPQASKAHSMLIALLGGLTDVENSNLASLLADVYHSMAATIAHCRKTGDHSKLGELIEGTAALRSAWGQIQ